jgi:hypothetical protein
MSTFVKTRAAADYICRHTLSDLTRQRALILAGKLGTCDAALEDRPGDLPPAVQGLLRDLVRAVRELAGSAWLSANSDDPDIAALTGLDSTPSLPAPRDLDEILSRCLWARFAPGPSRSHPAA